MIWILILNHLYLGDLILILKSSTYDDFAHLCRQEIEKSGSMSWQPREQTHSFDAAKRSSLLEQQK